VSAVLVDSNVLLDVMTEDSRWFSWSAKALASAAETSRLVINPIIYAEVSIRYSRIEDLNAVLPKTLVEREALPYEAAFLADYSFRSATIGCTPAARRAGINDASSAARASSSVADVSITGSQGFTPYS
jgi:predicted nucleic acid-binding protein